LVETWEDIDLYVPLMIDYEYWFKNTIDYKLEDQIKLVHQIVLAHKGRIHPFVPFDPARELVYQVGMNNPDGQLEKYGSLNLVKDAIEKRGFIGVKLYNSLGYKPLNNKEVEDHRKLMAIRNEKMQYLFRGEEYDRVLSDLYRYCEENEVPITTHCGMYGIESYPDASFHFGEARFWEDVLSKYKNLRLNLAHFGWNQKVRYGGEKSWVKDICRMMNKFENLYTDVSCHRVTTHNDRQGYLYDYKRIRRDYPIVKKRLLFGTDWHVLKRVRNYKKFKDGYVEVLKHNNLFTDAEIKDFLGGNALKFLGLLPGGKNRKRLEEFYNAHKIAQPKWFRCTERLKPQPECC
ncbi:MAG: amidohydrolase family protein, partial [Candidatus Zixiibacteriota bacterium]